MAGRLKGKSALITAAGQGIGRATALAMAAEGAHVLATDINGDLLKEIDGESGIETAVLDVLQPDAIQALSEERDAIDILANIAARQSPG